MAMAKSRRVKNGQKLGFPEGHRRCCKSFVFGNLLFLKFISDGSYIPIFFFFFFLRDIDRG